MKSMNDRLKIIFVFFFFYASCSPKHCTLYTEDNVCSIVLLISSTRLITEVTKNPPNRTLLFPKLPRDFYRESMSDTDKPPSPTNHQSQSIQITNTYTGPGIVSVSADKGAVPLARGPPRRYSAVR